MPRLGVNIDHVATVRQARKTNEPDPVWAAALAELGGADGITFHLREDRRHIQDRDVRLLRDCCAVPVNFELACDSAVLKTCAELKPQQATLVPERREEVTTEGGLDVRGAEDVVRHAISSLQDTGIVVSLFLDPDADQIDAAAELGVDAVELHTGQYAHAEKPADIQKELSRLCDAGKQIVQRGMILHAGHGLTYRNVQPVAQVPHMCDLNIGHSIIARAVMVGMQQAVRDMKAYIDAVN